MEVVYLNSAGVKEISLETIESEIDNLTCAFVDMLDNDPNDDSYEVVSQSLLNLRQMADQLLTED